MPIRLKDALRDAKRDIIARSLAEHSGNRTRTASTLGIQRTYLCRLIRELGLPRNPPPRPGRTVPAS